MLQNLVFTPFLIIFIPSIFPGFNILTRDAKKHVFFKPCFLCKKKSVFYRKKQFFNVFFVFFQLQEDF